MPFSGPCDSTTSCRCAGQGEADFWPVRSGRCAGVGVLGRQRTRLSQSMPYGCGGGIFPVRLSTYTWLGTAVQGETSLLDPGGLLAPGGEAGVQRPWGNGVSASRGRPRGDAAWWAQRERHGIAKRPVSAAISRWVDAAVDRGHDVMGKCSRSFRRPRPGPRGRPKRAFRHQLSATGIQGRRDRSPDVRVREARCS